MLFVKVFLFLFFLVQAFQEVLVTTQTTVVNSLLTSESDVMQVLPVSKWWKCQTLVALLCSDIANIQLIAYYLPVLPLSPLLQSVKEFSCSSVYLKVASLLIVPH